MRKELANILYLREHYSSKFFSVFSFGSVDDV